MAVRWCGRPMVLVDLVSCAVALPWLAQSAVQPPQGGEVMEIEELAHPGAPSRIGRLVLCAVALAGSTGCELIEQFLGPPGPEVVEEAQEVLEGGDLPAAASAYADLAEEHEGSIHVAVGHAYTQLLAGDYDGADATLAAVEEAAGDGVGEIKLRRALVALRASDLDNVKEHGAASGLPEGKLLAAEVHLVDLDSDQATSILREVASAGGAVGVTASAYLEMLDSGDQYRVGLAEANALWALGERSAACEAAEELVPSLPDDEEIGKPSHLLLWASRAVTSGHPTLAANLLDEIDFPPEGQAWRVQATRALVSVAQGDVDEGARVLDALAEGGAPADGVADARATACSLAPDVDTAKRLVGDLESAAVARCLMKAGAGQASERAPDGPLKSLLENR